MAQKQGGKGKTSSPSDKAYWARRGTGAGQKTRRMERHAKRMGKTVAQLGNLGAFSTPDFPKLAKEKESRFPIPMAALRELPNVAQQGGGFVIANGVILEAHVSTQALHAAFDACHTTPRRIVRQTPLGLSIVAEVLR